MRYPVGSPSQVAPPASSLTTRHKNVEICRLWCHKSHSLLSPRTGREMKCVQQLHLANLLSLAHPLTAGTSRETYSASGHEDVVWHPQPRPKGKGPFCGLDIRRRWGAGGTAPAGSNGGRGQETSQPQETRCGRIEQQVRGSGTRCDQILLLKHVNREKKCTRQEATFLIQGRR